MATSLPPAVATAYSPLLSPARESEGVAAAMWEHGWSNNEAHSEGEGEGQYKEASKVNSALAAVEICKNSHGPVALPLRN